MLAVQVAKPLQLGVVEMVPPRPGPGDVLVRVRRAGICGSDLHIYHGANPFARYPRVLGHEVMGEIEAVGEGVTGVAVGTRVVLDPVIACGRCRACRIGRSNVCARLEVIGVHRDGGMAERVVAPAANAIAVPDGLSDRAAALAEPFAVAANVLERTGIEAGELVLIYGAGTVGLTALQAARLHGARCIVVDLDEVRLERARALGAEAAVEPRSTDLGALVAELTEGEGVPLVVEGTGAPGVLEEAVRLAGAAGRVAILGFSAQPSAIPQQEITKKELTLVGSRLNRRLIPRVLGWLESGAIDAEALVTQEFELRAAPEAFALIETSPSRTCKVQITVEQD